MSGSEMNEKERKELIRETMELSLRLHQLEAKHTLLLERMNIRLGIDVRKLVRESEGSEEFFGKMKEILDSAEEQKPFVTNLVMEDLKIMAEINEFEKQIRENFRKLGTQPRGFDPKDSGFFRTSL